MPRPPTGRVDTKKLADGTLRFRLRFSAYGERESVALHEARGCACGCGGGWTENNAHRELQNILARVEAGIWERPKPPPKIEKVFNAMPSFHEFASYWLKAKVEGTIGKKPISKNTHTGYESALRLHLLPFFGRYALDEIDKKLCEAFRRHLIEEANELREALAAGADLRDEHNRKLRPLAAASVRGQITLLGQILDEAVEEEWIPSNCARSKRLKVHVPKPKRTFLEMDELACIEDAGAEQDPDLEPFAIAAAEAKPGSTAQEVALRLAEGKRQKQIAEELGVAKGTVHFHVRKLGAVGIGVYIGRKALLCTLGRAGVRNGELCNIKIGHARLHDVNNARLEIPDSKTETGIRVLELSPELAEALVAHIDRLAKAGNDTRPTAPLFQNERGGKMTRKSVGTVVHEATALATERMQALGMPPLPHVTPHSFRRTYVSILLLASEFDLEWVMKQVGHADSKMTLEVYNQLQQRVKREHGASFDRLIREARARLHGSQEPPPATVTPTSDGVCAPVCVLGAKTAQKPRLPRRARRGRKPAISRRNGGQRPGEVGRSGHLFSVVCSTN